jgi:hypothetical protein
MPYIEIYARAEMQRPSLARHDDDDETKRQV